MKPKKHEIAALAAIKHIKELGCIGKETFGALEEIFDQAEMTCTTNHPLNRIDAVVKILSYHAKNSKNPLIKKAGYIKVFGRSSLCFELHDNYKQNYTTLLKSWSLNTTTSSFLKKNMV